MADNCSWIFLLTFIKTSSLESEEEVDLALFLDFFFGRAEDVLLELTSEFLLDLVLLLLLLFFLLVPLLLLLLFLLVPLLLLLLCFLELTLIDLLYLAMVLSVIRLELDFILDG